jgi:hypothetical protein
MRKKKRSPLGDNNWLRTFYQLCGLDYSRAEIAIARRNIELAQAGEREPARLKQSTLTAIGA